MNHNSVGQRSVRAAALLLLVGLPLANGQPPQPKPMEPPPPKSKPVSPAPTPQPATPNPSSPAPATPAKPATNPAQPAVQPTVTDARPKAPDVGPYIVQSRQKDMMFSATVRLASDNSTQKETIRDPLTGNSVDMPKITPFEWKSIGMVWPVMPPTATSMPNNGNFVGEMRLNDQPVASQYKLLSGYPAGIQLARWDAIADGDKTGSCRQVQLQVTVPVSVFNVDFDEAGAMRVDWPKNGWPKEVESCMQPQLFVETGLDNATVVPYKDDTLTAALQKWFTDAGIPDPKKAKPVQVAKIITRGVWAAVQINDQVAVGRGERYGEVTSRTAEFAGVVVQPPSQALENGKASRADAAALLCALFKKAGLPARTVIGWDTSGNSARDRADNLGARSRNNSKGLRYWVEFPVYDEPKNTLNWVPVDIYNLRKSSSRPMGLEKPWRYFGTQPDSSSVVPFALQFHPPTDVVSYGAAAFWGWFVTPQAPKNAEQVVSFDAYTASKRAGDQPGSATPATMDDGGKKPATTTPKKNSHDDKKKKVGG